MHKPHQLSLWLFKLPPPLVPSCSAIYHPPSLLHVMLKFCAVCATFCHSFGGLGIGTDLFCGGSACMFIFSDWGPSRGVLGVEPSYSMPRSGAVIWLSPPHGKGIHLVAGTQVAHGPPPPGRLGDGFIGQQAGCPSLDPSLCCTNAPQL